MFFMRNLTLVILFVWSHHFTGFTQSLLVYPGDINNNGVVNKIDFLQLGLGYHFIGPPRNILGSNISFIPQVSPLWLFQLPGSLNMAYADCDGDGIVGFYNDGQAIIQNYGLERLFPAPTNDVYPLADPELDPKLSFEDTNLPAQVNAGQVLNVPIVLGDSLMPASDIYGIAFSIFTDPTYIDLSLSKVDFTQSSWANPDNDRIFMYKKTAPDRMDVSWVRTDQNHRSGYGPIGVAEFVIIVDVVGLQQQIDIGIDSIYVIDKFGNVKAAVGDTITIGGNEASSSSIRENTLSDQVRLIPNPATDYVLAEADFPFDRIEVYHLNGTLIFRQMIEHQTKALIDLSKCDHDGMYLFKMTSDKGTVFKKLQRLYQFASSNRNQLCGCKHLQLWLFGLGYR
jgi:Secretion system C-terminal sorting domain